MNPQVSVITLGVKDPDRAKQFYTQGLGCAIQQDHGEFVSLGLGDGSSTLALYRREALANDAGVPEDGTGFQGFTLSYLVDSAEGVDAVLASAVRAGAEIVKPPKSALWGYGGVFTDPDGYLWKAASSSKPKRGSRRDRSKAQLPEAGGATPSPREIVILLGAKDLKRTKQFYRDGLSCPIDKNYPGFVSFKLSDGSFPLALYKWDALAKDAGVAADGSGFRGFTLSYVVDSAEDVDAMLAEAERAGGTIAKPAEGATWGGYSGYFTDPDSNLWKVASSA